VAGVEKAPEPTCCQTRNVLARSGAEIAERWHGLPVGFLGGLRLTVVGPPCRTAVVGACGLRPRGRPIESEVPTVSDVRRWSGLNAAYATDSMFEIGIPSS
jgi:hypothetical protein